MLRTRLRQAIYELKRGVVDACFSRPEIVPDELLGVVSAFPMSYAAGRTLLDRCCELGLDPSSARVLIVGAFGGRDYFWLQGNGFDGVEILDLDHPSWGRANAVGDASAEETWAKLEPGYDLIVLCDVLEHIPDDAQVLRLAARASAPDGHVYISIPYHHDREDTHLRAYSAGTLRRLLVATGWEVVWWAERPGPLEVWPKAVTVFNYGLGLSLMPLGLGVRVLTALLDVEFRLNAWGRPLARLWEGHVQRGVLLMARRTKDGFDVASHNRRVFCEAPPKAEPKCVS